MKCIYHSADLDGHCSGAIVSRLHPGCELIGWNYGQEIPEIEDGETIYLVDVSFPIAEMYALARRQVVIHWIDHHVSALREYEEFRIREGADFYGLRTTEKAACELTWEYCFPNEPMPIGVRLLGVYDSWRFTDSTKEQVMDWQYGMRLNEETRPEHAMDFWAMFFDANRRSLFYERTMEKGRTCSLYQQNQNRKNARSCAFETALPYGPFGHMHAVRNLKVIAMNSNLMNAAVFESVYNSEEHDAMLCFYWSKRGFWRASLYSDREDIDCSMYARSYDGGGHKGAAGFQCAELPFVLNANI